MAGGYCAAVGVDRQDSVYFSNWSQIMKMDSAGKVTVFAGTGMTGSTDGPAQQATFGTIVGLAVDPAGDVLVTEADLDPRLQRNYGYTVRRISRSGDVTRIAGSPGSKGYVDGPGAAARFGELGDVAVATDFTVYVVDKGNRVVRRISRNGVVATVSMPQVGQPSVLAVASNDALIVTDGVNQTLWHRATEGDISVLAIGGGQVGIAAAIATDTSGNLAVADGANHLLLVRDVYGQLSQLAGRASGTGAEDGWGPNASFNSPSDLALGADGSLYVADRLNYCIRKVSRSGIVTTLAGALGVKAYADGIGSAARFLNPHHVAVGPGDTVYVADFSMIRRISKDGKVATLAGKVQPAFPFADGIGTEASFGPIEAIAADSAGAVYVVDGWEKTIRHVSATGVVTTVAGIPGQGGSNDGPVATARLNSPTDVAVDQAGNLFVLEPGAIRRVTGGVVSTLSLHSADPAFVNTVLWNAGSLSIDTGGNLYASRNGRLWKIKPDGDAVVIPYDTEPGLFGAASQVEVDTAGNLFCILDQRVWFAASTQQFSRIVNVSCRSAAGIDEQTLITGFVMSGGARSILARAAGPTLTYYGVAGAASSVHAKLYAGSALIAENNGWSTAQNANEIAATATRLGAFPLLEASKDSALLAPLSAGTYAMHASGDTQRGIVLAEVYDAGTGNSAGEILNISARSMAASGDSALIVGFVIAGTSPRRILIRAAGPTLLSYGIAGALPLPQLKVFAGGVLIAETMDWSSGPDAGTLPAVFSEVGAFKFERGTADAAIVLTLQPGAYTAQVSGVNGASGIALAEVYSLP